MVDEKGIEEETDKLEEKQLGPDFQVNPNDLEKPDGGPLGPEDQFRPPGMLETYSNINSMCNYVPLTKVMNHFYLSVTDYTWLE